MRKPDKACVSPTGNNPTNGQVRDDVNKTSQKTYKSLSSKKQKNDKKVCVFACPNCITLAEYLESRYEPLNIIDDSGDSIYSPMHEKYHDEHKSSIRNGQVFVAAEIVDNLLKKFKK